MGFSSADKVRFFFELFRSRTDLYALRWGNRRDGRSGWMPAIKGHWRKGMNRADTPYLPLTPKVIDAHLRGEAHIGLYPLSDDDTCWCLSSTRSVLSADSTSSVSSGWSPRGRTRSPSAVSS